jgi:hypothetical protein
LTNFLQQLLIRRVVGQIDVLPDDALLTIFDFCVNKDLAGFPHLYMKKGIEVWQPLVHVCRRWRSLVFGSPHRLNLRLVCTDKTPARDTLDVWPALPLILERSDLPGGLDNIMSILERGDRVCQIGLGIRASQLEIVLAAMQDPFAELTCLLLWSYDGTVNILPDSFLGGSAPRLRFLWLNGIPFPGLPKLLSSTTHLVTLRLWNIPHSGYMPPEAIVTALSTLTNLKSFWLEFQSPRSHPDLKSRCLPRSVLPVLTTLRFRGVSEYLDDLVARIDAPQLNSLYITFNDIVIDTPRLIQFICRTPMLKAHNNARVNFGERAAIFELSSHTPGYRKLVLVIRSRTLDRQASSLEQVFTSCLPPLSTVKDLYFYGPLSSPPDSVENALRLELFRPFTAVKRLFLSKKFARCIAPALQELVGESTAEVLPVLQNIFLEELEPSGPVQEVIGKLVAAREVTTHPISVLSWER